MVRVLGNGQVVSCKRSREEERSTTDRLRFRHIRHPPPSPARAAETRDQDLESQMEQLQTSLQSRLRSIRRREEACAADIQKIQERERQVSEREFTLKQQTDQILGQQGSLQQLQTELMDQYNAVVASLPRLEDRLQAARQLVPECATPATSCVEDAPLGAAEAGSSAAPCGAQRQPASSLQTQDGAVDDHLPEAPRTAHRILNDPSTTPTALPGTSEDAKSCAKANSQQRDSLPVATVVDVRPPSATSEGTAPAMVGASSGAAFSQHSPTEPPVQNQKAYLTDASQPAAWRLYDEAEQPSPAAWQQQEQEPPVTADEPRSGAVESSYKGADSSFQSETSLQPDHESAAQAPVVFGPAEPVVSEPKSAKLFSSQSSKERDALKNSVQQSLIQTRQRTTRQGSSQQAVSDAQAPVSAVAPSVTKSRNGLRPRADDPANSDKAGMTNLQRAEPGHNKQAGAESGRHGLETTFASSNSITRGLGRGRAFGRGGRRGRARSSLFRTSQSVPHPAGDLDEAVQALKATTESLGAGMVIGPAASRTAGGAKVLEDDELKPSFMRRPAPDRSPPSHGRPMQADTHLQAVQTAKEASSQDPNPRPITRRRTDPSKIAERAKAKAVMQKEVPDLLDILQQKGWADHVDLLEHCEATAPDNVYLNMHNILSRLCEGKMGSWQGRNVTGKGVVLEGEEGGKHEYCLLALEHLLERADAYSLNSEPVRWGWCRELSSFVFVFEDANRIVVEKPCYGHATYFFDLEEPLPVCSQVQRLIAVLSVPGVSRRKLLEDSSLDPGPDLTAQERTQLEAAGWKPGTTVRSLLNFTGDRIFHQSAEIMTGHKLIQRDVPDYKDKIAKVLSEGASGGRVTKSLQ